MQVTTFSDGLADPPFDLVVLGVFAGELKKTAALTDFDKKLQGLLSLAAAEQDFTGKAKQSLIVHVGGKLRAKRLALLGLGPRAEHTAEAFVRCGGASVRLGNAVGAAQVLVVLPSKLAGKLPYDDLVARGAWLGTYRFNHYKSDKGRAPSVRKVALQGAEKDALSRAAAVAEAVALARDWVNLPPSDLYPESFAAKAVSLARSSGLKCTVLSPEALKKKNMNLLLAVGAGSVRSPRLVHLTYTPPKASKVAAPLVLVGKGITFDSGGLCLKPPEGMLTMKMDMGGAAAVLATLAAIAKLKVAIPVHGILALAENMPSGTAYRPGDVVTSASGKTVEIINTDAEGRLVLADALHYAGSLAPRGIVDVATLTGACMIALGHHTTGLFCNDDALATGLLSAARQSGEDFWRMPLTPILREQLKSEVADLRHTGERYGGAITAALFLKEFIGTTAWAHLDIAGPAFSTEEGGATTKGGTGVPVATLVQYVVEAGAAR